MNFDQFNEKSKLVINHAQNKAISLNNQQILNSHLSHSIINLNDDFIIELLKYFDVENSSLQREVEIQINKIPKVLGRNLNIFFFR